MRNSILERTRLEDEVCHRTIDPSYFAWCVRQFALDAHRVLNDPFATALELVELSGRIDTLWRFCPAEHTDTLDQWLRSARTFIRTRDVPSSRAS